jgi:tRNA threonylcarbamoyladenosine biosynthesis protein TsaE
MEMHFSLKDINTVALEMVAVIGDRRVVAFHGEMGAGKTTFISAICKALGSRDVTGSPTFSIINQYNAPNGKIIYHMDWYRVKDEEEAIQAGIEDALYSGNLCLVEWPEKANGLLQGDCLHVYIKTIDARNRVVSIPEI